MSKTSPETVERIKKQVRIRFRHTDFQHEAIRELANLYYQREIARIEHSEKDDPPLPVLPETVDMTGSPGKPTDIGTLLRTKIKLPSLPTIFTQIMELMSDPNSDADGFSEVIRQDPALTARLLKIVNSAYYGYRSEIDTISHAVMIIGTSELFALCLSTSVISLFKDIPSSLVNMNSFWTHSIGCGMMAKKIAACKKEINRERFFVTGLLHDIGRLILFTSLPDLAYRAISSARENHYLLVNVEEDVFGFDHSKLGGKLMNQWKLPDKLSDVVRFHHLPEDSPEHADTAIVHLADIMVNALKMGSSGEQLVPPLNPVAWKTIGLPVETLAEIVQETEEQIGELSRILIAPG